MIAYAARVALEAASVTARDDANRLLRHCRHRQRILDGTRMVTPPLPLPADSICAKINIQFIVVRTDLGGECDSGVSPY